MTDVYKRQLQALFVHEGEIGAGVAVEHGFVDGVRGGLENVSRLIVAVHAVHGAADAFDGRCV